jgi:hypothetical protein
VSHGGVRLARVGGLALVAAAVAVGCFPGRGAAATPVVTVTPTSGAPASGSFQDGEIVTVTVTDNSVFTPGSKVNILECADPQGTSANLPKSISTCDGDTIQGDTVLVKPGGAASETDYTVYQLPSATLGERPDGQPVCNATNQCVLYVGQNQNDFTQPKVFSSPFTVTSGSGVAGAPSGSAGSGSSASAAPVTTTVSNTSSTPSTSDPQGSLAFTGSGAALPWLLAGGGALLLLGSAGRRWTKVRS